MLSLSKHDLKILISSPFDKLRVTKSPQPPFKEGEAIHAQELLTVCGSATL